MLNRLDTWIGRELMHPPIIWFCRRTGMTQRAVSRYAWMLAAWTLVMRISFDGIGNRLFAVLVILMTVRETAIAAIAPDRPAVPIGFLRRAIVLLTVFDIATLTVVTARHGFPGLHWGLAWDLFALVAEYAKTIDTIPPRRIKEREPGRRTGRSRGLNSTASDMVARRAVIGARGAQERVEHAGDRRPYPTRTSIWRPC